MSIEKQELLDLLAATPGASLAGAGAPDEPHDYQSLKEFIVRQELMDELNILNNLLADEVFDLDAFKLGFKARCRERARQNADSCLSFFAMPHGVCNTLYWDIARKLLAPSDGMLETLAILALDLRTRIIPDGVEKKDPSQPFHIFNLALCFKEEAVSSTFEGVPAELDRLSEWVVCDTSFVDVRDIKDFNFNWHQAYSDALHHAKPDLAQRLYQHNPALKGLSSKLAFISGEGQLPFQVLSDFIKTLRLGGTKMTGLPHASLNAQAAFTDFLCYLESLPIATKDYFLSLKSPDGKSLDKVLHHLHRALCVEVAAQDLQEILENPVNESLLNRHPTHDETYRSRLKTGYGKSAALPTNADGASTLLPKALLAKCVSQVRINTFMDWVSLLLSFPPELYPALMQYAVIHEDLLQLSAQVQLTNRVRENLLSREQKKGLYVALWINHQRYRGLKDILDFYHQVEGDHFNFTELFRQLALDDKQSLSIAVFPLVAHKKHVLLQTLLEALSTDDDRFAALERKDSSGETVFHCAALNPELLGILVRAFASNQDRLITVLGEKDSTGKTALQRAALKSESVSILVVALASNQDHLMTVLGEKDSSGNTLLHRTLSSPRSLQIFLDSLGNDEARLKALREQDDSSGNTVLESAVLKPESLRVILRAFSSDTTRLAVFREKECMGMPVIHGSMTESQSLSAQIRASLKAKGNTVLHGAVSRPASLRVFLESLSSDEARLKALKEKNAVGSTVIRLSVYEPKSLQTILQSLSSDTTRLLAIQTELSWAVSQPEALRIILESLSKEVAFKLLDEMVFPAIFLKGKTIREAIQAQKYSSLERFVEELDASIHQDAQPVVVSNPLLVEFAAQLKDHLERNHEPAMQAILTLLSRSELPEDLCQRLHPLAKQVMSTVINSTAFFVTGERPRNTVTHKICAMMADERFLEPGSPYLGELLALLRNLALSGPALAMP